MSRASTPVSVRIIDRDYTVGADEPEALKAAAQLLDSKMREIRGANKTAAIDRIAVLAGLNLAHELQQLRQQHDLHERELARLLTLAERKLDNIG